MNFLLSTSKINNASVCPRLFYFHDILEREPISKPAHLESGDLFHQMLEMHYNSKINNDSSINIIEASRNIAAKTLDLSGEDVEETIKLYKEYVGHYQYETWIPLAAEESFCKQLYASDDLNIFVEGKIDLRIETKAGGSNAVVDHKKTGRDNTPPERDNQKLAYCWATGYRDFIINQCGTQKSKKIDDRMKRYYFHYDDHQIQEWIDSTIDLAMEILDRMASNKYPARYTGCIKYGYKCSFYDVCNSQQDLWEWKLKSEFKKKDHNLFEKKVDNE